VGSNPGRAAIRLAEQPAIGSFAISEKVVDNDQLTFSE